MHPFDVEDRGEIDGVQMFVEEMNILTTIFLRFDNLKVTYLNTVLATMPLGNFYRSPDMGESIDFCIHVTTPVEKIAIMRERILGYLENKKEHWYPSTNLANYSAMLLSFTAKIYQITANISMSFPGGKVKVEASRTNECPQ
ncbi:hypothetical protein ZIOFF_001001 [Zingiber officinale]|uniref:Uncharacterized protein n=1 Tax=Zingiber officinale TaxID=94328 RepID=A0A8J5LY65_ZINOF|nr:hypothetical protein ZIOFF_001001 [Zingiber officinale]